MRLDHLSFAAGPDGLAGSAQRIGGLLGRDFVDGGVHPRFGTRNMVLPLADHTYLEVVEVLDHPASDSAPSGPALGGPAARPPTRPPSARPCGPARHSAEAGSAGSSRSTTSPRSSVASVARRPPAT